MGKSCPFDFPDETQAGPNSSRTREPAWPAFRNRSGMTMPAPVYRHGIYLLTRRVIWRLFLLLPDRLAVQIFQYVIGITLLTFEGAKKLEVHAAVLMSNHLHLVAYDPEAERTNFLNRLYAQLARAINKHRKRKGRLFDLPSHKDKSQIMDPDGILRSIVYTICNPVPEGQLLR